MSPLPLSAQMLAAPAARTWPPSPKPHVDAELEVQGETIGRYQLRRLIGIGGMASVYMGTCTGAADFSRIVAIKRMHPPFARDPAFVSRFRDEAWLCARLVHPNIVQTLDVVEWRHELLLVMEYVDGVTLQALQTDAQAAGIAVPPSVALGIMVPALHGLHAAHEATDDDGRPLKLVHRDCSPHNLMVGRDGNTKVLDFGVASARGQMHVTCGGELWGKFGYLAPEQIQKVAIDRRADVFAAGIVLWELLTGERLFREQGLSEAGVIQRVLSKPVPTPSSLNPNVDWRLDEVVLHALERDPAKRFESARDLALALEAAVPPATAFAVSNFVEQVSTDRLVQLSELRADVRRRSVPASRAQSHGTPELRAEDPTVSALPLPVSAVRPRSSSTRGRWLAFAIIITFVLAGTIAFALHLGPRLVTHVATPNRSPRAYEGAVPAASAARVAPVIEQPASTPTQAVPPQTSAAAESVAPHSGGAVPVSPTGKKRQRAADRRPQDSASKSPDTPSAAGNCDPPTYLDSDGIRHFKDRCL